MRRIIISIIVFFLGSSIVLADAVQFYSGGLCNHPAYDCLTITNVNSWQKLFPDPIQRDLVQRINRTNRDLRYNIKIAIPRNLASLTIFDVAPLPLQIPKSSGKILIVDQEKLAWAAYDRNGAMVRWGPIASGKDYCPDVKRSCKTITGIYYIFNKKDKKCESNIFPVGEGGAKMPYCMFFYKGFALHGSDEVFGYRDSHGCVRLFTEDAKWLNEQFVELSTAENNFKGTKVIIQRLKNYREEDNHDQRQ